MGCLNMQQPLLGSNSLGIAQPRLSIGWAGWASERSWIMMLHNDNHHSSSTISRTIFSNHQPESTITNCSQPSLSISLTTWSELNGQLSRALFPSRCLFRGWLGIRIHCLRALNAAEHPFQVAPWWGPAVAAELGPRWLAKIRVFTAGCPIANPWCESKPNSSVSQLIS